MESKIEILVVDDSRTQAELLRYLLEINDYEVAVASDGQQALAAARERQPALIISDIVMPGMDGYEMCSRIKQDKALQSIPVILLTQLSEPEDIVRGLRAKADYYLTKPYKPDYLLAKVKTVLEQPPQIHRLSPQGAMNGATLANGDLAEQYEEGLEVILGGKSYLINADRQQMLNLLFSTYENAVQQNRELTNAQLELEATNERLREQMALLTEAQQKLEQQRAELMEANAKLEALATSDGLTGLKNHRALRERFDEELQRAVRFGTPLSLVLLDVDCFKQYNDEFGHPEGDEILRTLGGLLTEAGRITDFIARYGGEEFALLLPNTGPEVALPTTERFREAIEQHHWPLRAVTASFGVTTFVPDGSQISLKVQADTMVREADEALYHSKAQGRNRVTYAAVMNNTVEPAPTGH